jgi:hypothetical protein
MCPWSQPASVVRSDLASLAAEACMRRSLPPRGDSLGEEPLELVVQLSWDGVLDLQAEPEVAVLIGAPGHGNLAFGD